MSRIVSATEINKSPNQYIIDVINEKKSASVGIRDYRIKRLLEVLREWAGERLDDVFVNGSSAKGTGLKGSSDIDLFISLKSNTSASLKDIYNSLYKCLIEAGFSVEKRNVAQRIIHYNLQIDIVPGKKLPGQRYTHYLYTNRWSDQDRIQTNVHNHVNHVINSGRINEILATKIWRQIHKLEFPSMHLEMYVLKALSGKWTGKAYLANNFEAVLEHISKYFHRTAIYDPSNASNVISQNLYKYEVAAIQAAAEKSLNKSYLKQIIY